MLRESMKNRITVSLAFLYILYYVTVSLAFIYILYYVLTGIPRRVTVDRYKLKARNTNNNFDKDKINH